MNTLQVDTGLAVRQIGENRFTLSGTTAAGNVSISAFDIQRIKAGSDITAFDVLGNAGQAYRLYQASLDRAPDTPGLSSQVNALDHGTSLHDIAAGFLNSAEFEQRNGTTLSNSDFVTALYQNTLHRAPDAAGQANWVNALNAGVIDRATTLIGFSESQENHLITDPVLVTGIHLDAPNLTFG